jgi:hypothetical protein
VSPTILLVGGNRSIFQNVVFFSFVLFKHWTTDKVQKLTGSKLVTQIILTLFLDLKLQTVPTEILAVWDMTPSRLFALTMEATISSETSVTVRRSTRRRISEDFNHHLLAMTTWHLSRVKRNLSSK